MALDVESGIEELACVVDPFFLPLSPLVVFITRPLSVFRSVL